MATVCKSNGCAGCMACLEACPVKAITIKEELEAYNAIIDENKCINCNACHRVCQVNNQPILCNPVLWKQGWSKDERIRESSSSGGLATAIETEFIKNGGIVCTCCFSDGKFGFKFAEHITELKETAGSKYVKSNPEGIYKELKDKLRNGAKVLFVGLPCQVAAVRNFVGVKLQEKLYTVDLICHGTPSLAVLEIFLSQHKINIKDLSKIKFRDKNGFRISGDYEYIAAKGTLDKYTIAFLNSLSYTENCYSCQYARLERASDMTLGDAWSSELPKNETSKGVSLILCQTEKGKDLLNSVDVELLDIDLDRERQINHQLLRPSYKPEQRARFLNNIREGECFDKLVWKTYKIKCFKQIIKAVLFKLRIYRGKVAYGISVKVNR